MSITDELRKMTPTSDERREVAERLRKAANFDEWLDLTIENAILGVFGEVRRPIADTLADLIDPTCEMEAAGDVPALVKGSLETFFCSECGSVPALVKGSLETFFCSECGSPIYNDVNPSYCLYCGHRVVSDDD